MGDLNIAGFIYDSFVYNGSFIVVLNTQDYANCDLSKLLLLGRIENSEHGSRVVPVDENEYDDIVEYYIHLQSAFLRKEETY